ncbi:MAG: phage holin family protein [Algoriphagus sp.]|jgi:cobalamin biosynthesis protein CobD/CbiB|nr:phage holin family protein [Cyclobacteriaceae bacterium]
MLNFTEILQTLKAILETKIEMVKSDIQDQLVGILSRLILLVLLGCLMLLVFLFVSLSLAFFISQVTQSPYLGFLAVGLLYLLLVLILYLSKDAEGVQQSVNSSLKRFIFKSTSEKKSHE